MNYMIRPNCQSKQFSMVVAKRRSKTMHNDIVAVSYHSFFSFFLVKREVLQEVNVTSLFDLTKEERS